MLRYIFFPTGRQVWFDLAQSLYRSRVAKPVVWAGDSRLDAQAVDLVHDGVVIDFVKVHSEIDNLNFNLDDRSFLVYEEVINSSVREKAIKMMDRHDPYGAYRNIDRDVFFKYFVLLSLDLIKKYDPDFVLMAESPHSPFQFVLYEVSKAFNIQILSFASWSIAPISHIREDINGEIFDVALDIETCVEKNIFYMIDAYLNRFDGINFDIDPDYMKQQKRQDELNSKKIYRIKKTFALSKRFISGFSNKYKGVERGFFSGTKIDFIEPVFKYFVKNKNIEKLRSSMVEAVELDSIPKKKYAYFPLHYEPERTTNPDGLDFYDQINTIISLRNWLPSEIVILVKEHYSQFTTSLQGYKGRSTEFYNLLKCIEGVYIVDPDISSKKLIQGSCLTATITGTAALESALLGVPALIFGNPWFRGVPGTWAFSISRDYENVINDALNQPWNRSEIREWIFERVRRKCLFLSINPSNERYFSDFYEDRENIMLESDALFKIMHGLISSKVKKRNKLC